MAPIATIVLPMYGRSFRDPSKAFVAAERSDIGCLDAMSAASEKTYASYKCLPEKSNSAQHGVKQQQIDSNKHSRQSKKDLDLIQVLTQDTIRISMQTPKGLYVRISPLL